MTSLEAELYLIDRASAHGVTVDDLLDMTPTSVSDDYVESAMFWEQRDYSHIKAVSVHPELADDPSNAIPEDPSVNRARGADEMTIGEQMVAEIDNEILAYEIDMSYYGDEVPFYFF